MKMAAILTVGVALLLMTTAVRADAFGTGTNAFTVDFVTVGDPGNANDSGTTGSYSSNYGGVGYAFRMGTYEVSRQIITKANSAGTLGITLYDMTSFGGNGANRPATGVSWNEAARFVNWLNTSTGHQAAYKFAAQPGEGGYSPNSNILLWGVGDAGYDPSNMYRNKNAFYFLPNENEWYKAAYYSGSGNTYFDFPTGSNTSPTAVAGGTGSGSAVYAQLYAAGPADVDNAGGPSHYGTYGQGGNVWDWVENTYNATSSSTADNRVLRGGHWGGGANDGNYGDVNLRSGTRTGYAAPTTDNNYGIGFRVASVPEPATLSLLALGVLTLLKARRRKV